MTSPAVARTWVCYGRGIAIAKPRTFRGGQGRLEARTLPLGPYVWEHDNMVSSIVVTRKKRGRPTTGGADPIVPLRMPMAMRDALDSLMTAEPEPQPSRSEAVRRALVDHLRAKGYPPAASDQP